MVDLTISLAEGVLYGATVALAAVSLVGLVRTRGVFAGLREVFARGVFAHRRVSAQPITAALPEPAPAPVAVPTPAQAPTPTPTVASAFLAALAAQEPRVVRPFACADWPEPVSFHGYALLSVRSLPHCTWN